MAQQEQARSPVAALHHRMYLYSAWRDHCCDWGGEKIAYFLLPTFRSFTPREVSIKLRNVGYNKVKITSCACDAEGGNVCTQELKT